MGEEPVSWNAFSKTSSFALLNTDIHLQGKCEYRNDRKFSDIYACANSADPDQTAPRGAV